MPFDQLLENLAYVDLLKATSVGQFFRKFGVGIPLSQKKQLFFVIYLMHLVTTHEVYSNTILVSKIVFDIAYSECENSV